jgi:hypothetical protein
MRSKKGAALALTLPGARNRLLAAGTTLQVIEPCSSNAPEQSRCRPQSAAFLVRLHALKN